VSSQFAASIVIELRAASLSDRKRSAAGSSILPMMP